MNMGSHLEYDPESCLVLFFIPGYLGLDHLPPYNDIKSTPW